MAAQQQLQQQQQRPTCFWFKIQLLSITDSNIMETLNVKSAVETAESSFDYFQQNNASDLLFHSPFLDLRSRTLNNGAIA